jgi:hypothetical protein
MIRVYDFLMLLKGGFSIKAAWLLSQRETVWNVVTYMILSFAAIILGISTAIASIEEVKKEAVVEASIDFNAKITKLENILISCLSNKPVVVDGIAAECKIQSLGIKL